jgi:hypothetical protein
VLNQSDRAAILIHRRNGASAVSFVSGPDAILDLQEIGAILPLAEIYARIGLAPEPSPDATPAD